MSYRPPNLDASIARLSAQLEAMRNDLHAFTDNVNQELREIKTQTTLTNGRLRDLETWRVQVDATKVERDKHVEFASEEERDNRARSERLRLIALTAFGSILSGVIVAVLVFLLLPGGG